MRRAKMIKTNFNRKDYEFARTSKGGYFEGDPHSLGDKLVYGFCIAVMIVWCVWQVIA